MKEEKKNLQMNYKHIKAFSDILKDSKDYLSNEQRKVLMGQFVAYFKEVSVFFDEDEFIKDCEVFEEWVMNMLPLKNGILILLKDGDGYG